MSIAENKNSFFHLPNRLNGALLKNCWVELFSLFHRFSWGGATFIEKKFNETVCRGKLPSFIAQKCEMIKAHSPYDTKNIKIDLP
jgi:hypothetical protein